MARLNSLEDTINPHQLLFGINQGCTFEDLRVEHMKRIAELDLDGYAIGGLAVGEPTEEMYRIIEAVEPHMPKDKIRYLISRNARHGHAFTWEGCRNLLNAKYELDEAPLDENCQCPVCQKFSRAYIHHLFKAGEMLAMRLTVMHNLYFYNHLMECIRDALDTGCYEPFYQPAVTNRSTRNTSKLWESAFNRENFPRFACKFRWFLI